MGRDERPEDAIDGLRDEDRSKKPFRASGSGRDYDPAGNWGAERRRDHPAPGLGHGMEGAPSGAGDGGYGPEGGYTGDAAEPNAEVLGQVNGDPDALIEEAQEEGTPKPGRATTD
jgi:hypothetical protein